MNEKTNDCMPVAKGMRKRMVAYALGAALLAVACFGMAGCSTASDSQGGASGDNVAPVEETSSSTAASASQMSIEVTLDEDVTKATDVDSPLQFAEEKTTVAVAEGATALDALQATGREVVTSGSGDSIEVESIGGLEKGSDGADSHWQYAVNGELQTSSPAVYVLSEGDDVVFTFVH